MKFEARTVRRTINKAYLKEPIEREAFNQFKVSFQKLIDGIQEAEKADEREEHFKNLLPPFFKKLGFDDYNINTSSNIDLAIYTGSKTKDPLGVLMEVKRPLNKPEMISPDRLNRKAMHEAVLYYLEQRIEEENSDLKHVIITDMNHWFVFDAQEFERCFYRPSILRKAYKDWKNDRKVSSNTDFMYNEIASYLTDNDGTISGSHFSLSKIKKLLKGTKGSDYEKRLIPYFKLFTPTHLLKEPFANDSNSLNKEFYRELLYILGLEETRDGSTRYIQRVEKENRHAGSLIENTIRILDAEDHLSTLSKNRKEYGETRDDQLFGVALELCITWMNRILFLKLLEAQLFKYHREDPKFKFLNFKMIGSLDELNKLFFQVLARKQADRSHDLNEKYGHIPYLNSSLFDVAAIEHDTTRISGLDDHAEMDVNSRSILSSQRKKSLNTLEYLFQFLEAYDFTAEGSEEIRDEHKTLINASVLGLIFEKINGYKDGSFYTPGFITEYMARETLRKAVIDKFAATLTPGPSPAGSRRGEQDSDRVEEPGWKLPDELIENARHLWKNQTDAEEYLWQLLRNRQLYGYKFRRQHPIKPGFILDFYCAKKKLAVELDGPIHDRKDQKISDAERTQILNEKGIQIIRFKNEEVLNDTERVLYKLANELGVYGTTSPRHESLVSETFSTGPPSPRPDGHPSPAGGRGAGGEGGELTFTGIYNRIGRDISIQQANEIINSITICDPAVGSGHFLVSCLNELLAIKSDLGILCDSDGKLLRGLNLEIENDELIISWEDEELFEYDVSHTWRGNQLTQRSVSSDHQRVQKTLFNEKRYLIENCLFGVDINPNSVKICRLRLWIELLKRAYYTERSKHLELEVLPNIDINIKQGNSLVSRFELDLDLSAVFKNSDYSLDDYKQAVRTYKETGNRDEKQRLSTFIEDVKENFVIGLRELHPERKKLKIKEAKLVELTTQFDMFGDEIEGEAGSRKVRIKMAEQELEKQKEKVEALESGAFYNQAFEWRFEFPEVLDGEGRFAGFDVVIGNPPYVRQEQFKELKPYLKNRYTVYQGTADLYSYFIELGMDLLTRGGHFQYIVANKWMRANYGQPLREWLQQEVNIEAIYDFGDLPVFEEATTYPCLLQLKKITPTGLFQAAEIETLDFDLLEDYLKQHRFESDQTKLQPDGWALIDEKAQNLLEKLKKKGAPLGEYVNDKIYRGIITGLNEAFVVDAETKDHLIKEDSSSADLIKPFLAGRDIKRYQVPKTENYLILVPNGFTNENRGDKNAWTWFSENYPAIANHLKQFEKKAKKRYDQGQYWWELRACDYYDEFEKPKLIYPNICIRPEFTFDDEQQYTNQKCFIVSLNDKKLLGVLNSKIMRFYFETVLPKLRGDYFEPSYIYMKHFPVPFKNSSAQKELTSLVEEIIKRRKKDPEVDITVLESEIDRLVYELYGLSEKEIEVVEG